MILVTGGTGNIGRPLLRELAGAGASVRALVRDPEQGGTPQASGVEAVAGDLGEAASLRPAVDGIETAFLLTPVSREQLAWKRNLIRAARAAGVKRIVHLSVAGAAPDSPLILGRWHWESERELEASGMAWTHLRPYDLARYNTRLFLSTAREQGKFYSTVGEGKVAMVDEGDVAAAAARALLDGSHAGKTYTLSGPVALSYAEMAAEIGRALGKRVGYVDVSEADARAAMLGMGLPDWIADFINDLRRMERGGGAAWVSPDVERVTGRAATSYADSVRAALG